MKPIAALANCAWLAASLPAWLRFRSALRLPGESQRCILNGLLNANAESEYGRAYGFGEIRSYIEYRERVPVVNYDDLEPWIARIMCGEQGVLTREPVTHLVPTSGSTSGRKLIPFTAALQSELNAAIGPWIVELCCAHPAVPFGPAYWSISPAIMATADQNSTVPVGFDDDSAYLGGFKRRLAEATFAVPSPLRLVKKMNDLRYLTLLCLLRQPELRLVSVWHPSFFTLLLDALPILWEELLRDLADGTCNRADALPGETRHIVHSAPQLRRSRMLCKCGPTDTRTIWPRLQIVTCWGDAQASLARAELQRRMPWVAVQCKGLLATEAFVSIPFRGLHPLAINSHFFEFEDACGEVRLAGELCTGESYTVIVTTAGGLWRYRLGDLVEVDGFVAATPSLRFLGRGASVSDLCGEKLAELFVTRAIEAACAYSGFAPSFAMLAPEVDSTGCWSYTLFVEGSLPPELPLCLDAELRKNPHYALCRDLSQLGPLRCFQVASGAYQTFCIASAFESRRIGDIKPQSLSLRSDWRIVFAGAS